MAFNLPQAVCGLRLCKMRGDNLILCETLIFDDGRNAVDTVLRRAQISGEVGPVGETGDLWADLMDRDGDLVETIALSRGAWNALKNKWAHWQSELLPLP